MAHRVRNLNRLLCCVKKFEGCSILSCYNSLSFQSKSAIQSVCLNNLRKIMRSAGRYSIKVDKDGVGCVQSY